MWKHMELGDYLIRVRCERGYSQRDLAEKSGISPAEISRVESGKRQKVSPSVLRALAETLVISYPYLLQLAGYMDDPENATREMMNVDAEWANVAYRVSRELSESDRRILTDQAKAFLDAKRDERR